MGVDTTVVARVVGIDTNFVNLNPNAALRLPQRVALIGQGTTVAEAAGYALTPLTVTSASTVGSTYGFGSPLHLSALELLPQNGDGLGTVPLTIYPLNADGSGVAAVNTITATGTQVGAGTYQVTVNGISSASFGIPDGTAAAAVPAIIIIAVAANVNMPVIATDATGGVTDLTTKWKGASSNLGVVSVSGPSNGITFGFAQDTPGSANPSVQPALNQIMSVWETQLVNTMELGDDTALDAYAVWGEGRWATLTNKPAVVTTGSTETVLATNQAIGNGRKGDRINSVAWSVGGLDFPFQVAARQVARIAVVANNNPARDYAGQKLSGLEPGADGDQFDYGQRDAVVKAGVSTTQIIDGVVTISDTVTFYHPNGENPPAFRYVATIVKLQNLIYNLNIIFDSPEWNGAPLIPDIQPTTNPDARKPKDAIAAVNAMLDGAGLIALISDPATAKKATTALIDTGNPNRLNVGVTVQISGNVGIISIDLDFGFFFGTATVI